MTLADPNVDPVYAAALLRRAAALQTEANSVLRTLDLLAMLSVLGQPEHIGSSVSGLMVFPDIDITVRCRDLTLERAWEALRPLLVNPRVARIDYRNQTGARSPSGTSADERLYVVLRYESELRTEWKIDLSLWTSDAPRPHLGELTDLMRRLTADTRLAILWIKDVWCRLPVYPDVISGYEVYGAVLDHDVRTPDDFDTFLRAQGLPGR
jgi:hypothetical protein